MGRGAVHGEAPQDFAESETSFFLKGLDVQIKFGKDAKGAQALLLVYQDGGQQEAKKVK